MFTYIKGLLVASTPSNAVVDINGIGYVVLTHFKIAEGLPAIGDPVQFYTTFVVREFSHSLYGFLDTQERDIFEVLMNITGIGPKLALSLIGHLSFHELQIAVSNHDLTTLCRVPGVGKKTAERLIVELKDKLPALSHIGKSSLSAQTLENTQSNQARDAMLALINLGYNQNIAQKAIKQSLKEFPEENDLGSLIKRALKYAH